MTKANERLVDVEGRKITLSNLDKVFYPKTKFTKGQVIDYYIRISKYILPHLKNRPVTLKRFPDGVGGQFFYEKRAPSHTPTWVRTFEVPSEGRGGKIDYILINDLPTLAWLANAANLEVHPFLHRTPRIERPTAVVFDLDTSQILRQGFGLKRIAALHTFEQPCQLYTYQTLCPGLGPTDGTATP